MLNHQELYTLIAVIDEGSFEAASQRLFITTGAVSQRIKSLENQIGSPILIRSNPPKLTKTGESIMLFARKISLLQEEVMRQVKKGKNDSSTTLSIAVNYDSIISWFLDAAIKIGERTDLLLDIKTTSKDATQQLLKSGSVIAAVTAKKTSIPGCKSQSLGALEYIPVCSHAFYEKHFKSGVTKDKLLIAPVIYFSHEDYSGDSFLQKYGLLPEDVKRHFMPSSKGILEMVKKDIGWAPLPRFLVEELSISNSLIIFDPHVYQVELFWKTWELASSTISEVSQLVLKEAQEKLTQVIVRK